MESAAILRYLDGSQHIPHVPSTIAAQENCQLASQSSPDLIKVTEIFLIPSSFLVAAVGTADTNIHRALASLLGLIVSVLWLMCSRDAQADILVSNEVASSGRLSRRTKILCLLPVIFVGGWTLSTVIHAMLWNRPLGS